MKKESACDIEQMLMLTLCDVVLFRGFDTCGLMNDSFRGIIVMHEKLSPIITSYDFYFAIILGFNGCNEVHDDMSGFGFSMHEMYPCKA